jgi:hypothetical protein
MDTSVFDVQTERSNFIKAEPIQAPRIINTPADEQK